MARKDAGELANDLNWQAFQVALKSGQFKELVPGTWVAYVDGQLVASGTHQQVMESVEGKGAMIKEVNVPERVIDIPTVFEIRGK